jgi:hypothetical protein
MHCSDSAISSLRQGRQPTRKKGSKNKTGGKSQRPLPPGVGGVCYRTPSRNFGVPRLGAPANRRSAGATYASILITRREWVSTLIARFQEARRASHFPEKSRHAWKGRSSRSSSRASGARARATAWLAATADGSQSTGQDLRRVVSIRCARSGRAPRPHRTLSSR